MDCQTCNDLLLDLAYGELDDVRAAAMRRHIDACAECRAALTRIERGRSIARRLTDEEVPSVSTSVRQALAAALMAQPTTSVATAGGSSGSLDAGNAFDDAVRESSVVTGPARWFERVGELAMKRQVAMAAVFLLMIGVGLIFYQSHPRPNDTTEDRRPDVVPSVEVNGNVGSGETPRRAAPASVHATERDDLRPRAVRRAAASDEVRTGAPPAPSPMAAPRAPNPADFENLASDQNGPMPTAPASAPTAPPPQPAVAGGDVAPPSVRAQAITGAQQAAVAGNAQGARLNANPQEAQTNQAQPPAHAAAAANNVSPPAVQASAPASNPNADLPTQHNRVPSSLRHPMRHTGGRSRQPDDSQSQDMGL